MAKDILIKDFNHKTIIKELKEFGKFAWNLIPYADFIFSDYTQEIFDEINDTVYKDEQIDSRMIIGILLCGIEDNTSNFAKLERLTKTDRTYSIFTRDYEIKKSNFESFLKNCDEKLLKKLFLTTVVEFRDLDFFNLSKMYTYSNLIIPHSNLSVQQTMIKNNIFLQSLVIPDNNDETALNYILEDLKDTENILADLQDSVGHTGSESTVHNAFKRTQMLLHPRYCSDENLEAAYLHEFDILTKPKELTKEIPEKYKLNSINYKDEIFKKYKKLTTNHLFRKTNGYGCIYNKNSKLINSYINDSEYNNSKVDLPDDVKEWTYEYEMNCEADCPFEEICFTKTFKQNFTPLKNKMLNKFMNKANLNKYSEIKNANYQISMRIRKIKETLNDADFDEKLVQKYVYLINTSINIKRKIKLKGTRY